MFPTVHGILSQGGVSDAPDPDPGEFTPAWASLTTPSGQSYSNFASGWAFTVNRALTATKARVRSSVPGSVPRIVAIWRQSDGVVIASTGSFTATGSGWHERDFPTPVDLVPGETYVVVVWRHTYADASVYAHDTSQSPWQTIPEVTFLEGRRGGYNNNALPTTVTNLVNGVDLWLE